MEWNRAVRRIFLRDIISRIEWTRPLIGPNSLHNNSRHKNSTLSWAICCLICWTNQRPSSFKLPDSVPLGKFALQLYFIFWLLQSMSTIWQLRMYSRRICNFAQSFIYSQFLLLWYFWLFTLEFQIFDKRKIGWKSFQPTFKYLRIVVCLTFSEKGIIQVRCQFKMPNYADHISE